VRGILESATDGGANRAVAVGLIYKSNQSRCMLRITFQLLSREGAAVVLPLSRRRIMYNCTYAFLRVWPWGDCTVLPKVHPESAS
jgi:hypothetical protein